MQIEGKECGPCSVCCTVLGVDFPKYYKPPETRCKHQCAAGGCRKYDDRPDGCRVFDCAWLTFEAMPEASRPDKSGLLFIYEHQEEGWNPFTKRAILVTTDQDPSVFHSDIAKACYRMFWDRGTPVWLQHRSLGKILIDTNGQKLENHQYSAYLAKLSL